MDFEKMNSMELDKLIDSLELKKATKEKEEREKRLKEKEDEEAKEVRMKVILLNMDSSRSLYFIKYFGVSYTRCLTPNLWVEWRQEVSAGHFVLVDGPDENGRLEVAFRAARWNDLRYNAKGN